MLPRVVRGQGRTLSIKLRRLRRHWRRRRRLAYHTHAFQAGLELVELVVILDAVVVFVAVVVERGGVGDEGHRRGRLPVLQLVVGAGFVGGFVGPQPVVDDAAGLIDSSTFAMTRCLAMVGLGINFIFFAGSSSSSIWSPHLTHRQPAPRAG